MQNFEGKVAVITGAASGIGLALTQKCLSLGMSVVMADIEEQVLNKVAEEIQASGENNILTVPTDVSVLAAIEELAEKAINHFGAVHLLFNNAGVGGGGSGDGDNSTTVTNNFIGSAEEFLDMLEKQAKTQEKTIEGVVTKDG